MTRFSHNFFAVLNSLTLTNTNSVCRANALQITFLPDKSKIWNIDNGWSSNLYVGQMANPVLFNIAIKNVLRNVLIPQMAHMFVLEVL